MEDADAADARERDREARLGDRVHRRGDDRHVRARSSRVRRVAVETAFGSTAGLRRNEQDVVERKTLPGELLRELDSGGRQVEFSDVLAAGTGRAGSTASTAASSSSSTSAWRRPGMTRVEASGARFERRRRPRRDGGTERFLVRAAGMAGGEEAGEQHVTRADARTSGRLVARVPDSDASRDPRAGERRRPARS